jgi:hypothetical protein
LFKASGSFEKTDIVDFNRRPRINIVPNITGLPWRPIEAFSNM